MSQGVFQIDRAIFRNDIWINIAEFRIFFYIVGNAVWKEEGRWVGDIHLKRGQYLRSYRNLREDLMYVENNSIKYYSISSIKTKTDQLVKDGRLKKEETKLGTLFTVVNYSMYQGFGRFVQDGRKQEENNKKKGKKSNKDNKTNKTIRYGLDNKYYKLAITLKENVLKINPNCKVPNSDIKDMQKWANDIRLIFDMDKRSEEDFLNVVDFVFSDDFWHTVIQSPSGLRRNWDKIYVQMNSKKTSTINKKSKFVNFEQSGYDFNKLEKLEQSYIEQQIKEE